MSIRLLSLLPALALALALAAAPARAGSVAQLDAAIHRLLDDDRGWTLHREPDGDGISVYAKDVPSLGLTAFKGVKVLDPAVDPERFFEAVSDIGGQKRYSKMLLESRVVQRSGNTIAYYQVIEPPPMVPGAQRFWVNTGVVHRDLGGEAGHHKRAWSAAPPGTLSEVHADLSARYPKAVEVEISHGSWEIDPQDDGSILYIYRTVSHPGGSIPSGIAKLLAVRTLPDNMLTFEAAGRR